MTLTERLRARKAFGIFPGDSRWSMLDAPDPDCVEAADRIEALEARLVEVEGKWNAAEAECAEAADIIREERTSREALEARLAEAEARAIKIIHVERPPFRLEEDTALSPSGNGEGT